MIPNEKVKLLASAAHDMGLEWAARDPHSEPILTFAFPFYPDLLHDVISEFASDAGWSDGTMLLPLAFHSIEPRILILVAAGMRLVADDLLGHTIATLSYHKLSDRRFNAAMRWLSASILCILGPLAQEARPAILRRLRLERNKQVRPALILALGSLGKHTAADYALMVSALWKCPCTQAAGEVALHADDFSTGDIPWFHWGSGQPPYASMAQVVPEGRPQYDQIGIRNLPLD